MVDTPSTRLVIGVIHTFKIASSSAQLLVQARCQRSVIHPLQIWKHQLGICKMSPDQPAKKHATSYRFTVLPVLKGCGCKNLIFNKTGNARINVTLRRVRVTIVVVGKQKLLFKLRIFQ